MVLGGNTGRVPSEVTLDNWQSATHLHWTFQHVADFLPTAVIARGTGPIAELRPAPSELSDIPLYDKTNARRTTVGEVMAATATDGWIVTQRGAVLTEQYYSGMAPDSSHLLMSVSKSLIAIVVGALAGNGALDVSAQLSAMFPRLRNQAMRARRSEICSTCVRDSVFRGLPQPDGGGPAARTGNRVGAANGAGAADHHV